VNRILIYARPGLTSLALLLLSLVPAFAASPNDVARYLAGLPVAAESDLAPLMREGSWKQHARILDQAWARISKNQLSNIRVWSKENLLKSNKQMLYMFSGPDFLYADAFFPNAQTYVLCALEPVGPIPNLGRMSAGARASALQEFRGSIQTVLSYSFFITKQMKVDMRGGRIQGNLPVLLVFLARSGNSIEDVEFVRLNPDGLAVPPDVGIKGSSPGVRIYFKDDKGKSRTLYYFQTDLSNGGLKNSGFRAFSEALGPADSLIKSASYLLHSGNFSLARNVLLMQSDVIVQDASGIPLRNFPKAEWEFHPFGRYAGPISIFANHYQPDMVHLFRKGSTKPVNFGIGYRWRRHETHTLLAIKKQN
jgi:hypothetical protein